MVLMLDLPDMSEKGRFFYFLEGSQPWERTELQIRSVQDLAFAQTAAERLTYLTFVENSARRISYFLNLNANISVRPGQIGSGEWSRDFRILEEEIEE
ncbi:hypothetical protein ACLB2K_031326 [Fragaria x ananassa]